MSTSCVTTIRLLSHASFTIGQNTGREAHIVASWISITESTIGAGPYQEGSKVGDVVARLSISVIRRTTEQTFTLEDHQMTLQSVCQAGLIKGCLHSSQHEQSYQGQARLSFHVVVDPQRHRYSKDDEVQEHVGTGVGEEAFDKNICIVRAESVSPNGIIWDSKIPESVDREANVRGSQVNNNERR